MLWMKSVYFTSKQIEQQAQRMLDALGIRKRPIEWDHPALLVLDMQEYFLSPDSHAFVPSAPAILPGILDLIDAFTRANTPVIFTRHLNTPDDAGMMARWWRDLLTRDHPHAGLVKPLAVKARTVIEKSQYDAFHQTDLDRRLRTAGITDVVVTGVMTHLCCETTARSAFMHGYRVWFAADGTASYNADFHLAALRSLSHGFAAPVYISELLEALA
jgi:isochorismate hydrolase